jgi:hypothetical protein
MIILAETAAPAPWGPSPMDLHTSSQP